MAADLEAVAAKIAEIVTEATGLRMSTDPVDNVNPPMGVLALTRIGYHVSMGQWAQYDYRLSIVIGRTNAAAGWKLLEEFLSPYSEGSVRAALLADQTLGGLVRGLAVGGSVDIGTTQQQDTPFIVGSLEVTVHA